MAISFPVEIKAVRAKHSFSLLVLALALILSFGFMAFAAVPLQLQDQTLASLTVGSALELQNSKIKGPLVVGGALQASDTQMQGSVTVGGSGRLSHVELQEGSRIGNSLTAEDSTIQGALQVGNDLTLRQTSVAQSAQVGGQAELHESTIEGDLHLGGPEARLSASEVDNIIVEGNTTSFHSSTSIIGSGNSSIVAVNGRAGHAMARVGNNSSALINGYQIRSSNDKTTLITPEGTVYQNAKKVSGEGPARYAAYLGQHSDAPQVNGPGWQAVDLEESSIKNEATTFNNQAIYLTNKSKVRGNIEFKSPGGKVYISSDSSVSGKVIGGTLIQQ